jgi:hypothetical protein
VFLVEKYLTNLLLPQLSFHPPVLKGGPILNIYLNIIKKKYNCFVGVGGFIPRQRHRAPNKSKVPEGGMHLNDTNLVPSQVEQWILII